MTALPTQRPLISKRARRDCLRRVSRMLRERPTVLRGTLAPLVKHILAQRTRFLGVMRNHKTPCYILDLKELKKSITDFQGACERHLPSHKIFYAVKTNHHPRILKEVIRAGFGLDVSSTREIEMGVRAGAQHMVYSGPGKTEECLATALKHHNRVTVNIDSFGELKRLGLLTKKFGARVRAGVRIAPHGNDAWNKFGIAMRDLREFWRMAQRYPGIALEGVQFHSSFNKDAVPYQRMIKLLSSYLKRSFSKKQLHDIRFIDIGGGFRPYRTEGLYPWTTPAGTIIQAAYAKSGIPAPFTDRYFLLESLTTDDYLAGIAEAVRNHLARLLSCAIYLEPGRIISNNAMHVALTVVDRKSPRTAILDGGVNAIGWERFSYDYFPVINLTHPGMREKVCTLYGSLCLQGEMDLWGYSYYGSALAENDNLVIPYQGHLTYSLAQNFIHPIPPVYILK